MTRRERKLYDHIFEQPYEATGFAYPEEPEAHPQYSRLKGFVDTYGLAQERCLEIGIGRGAFQNLVSHYYGIDIALSVGKLATSPFAVASATDLPFPANCFDGVWTLRVLEHVAQPERGLQEILRVLRPGGYLFITASWQVGL